MRDRFHKGMPEDSDIQDWLEDLMEEELEAYFELFNRVDYRETTEALLNQLKRSDLNAIRQFHGFKGMSQLRKRELADALSERLMDRLPHLLSNMTSDMLFVLQTLIKNKGKDPTSKYPYATLVFFKEIGLGIPSVGIEEDMLYMAQDLLQQVGQILSDEAIKRQIEKNDRLGLLMQGIINAFGTLSREDFLTILGQYDDEALERQELIRNYLHFTNQVDAASGMVCHFAVVDLALLLGQTLQRTGMTYRLFTYDEVLTLGHLTYYRRLESYQAFWTFLTEEYGLYDDLAEEFLEELVFRLNEDIPRAGVFFFIENFVEIPDEDMRAVFGDLVSDLERDLPKWPYKGYRIAEFEAIKKSILSPAPQEGMSVVSDNRLH